MFCIQMLLHTAMSIYFVTTIITIHNNSIILNKFPALAVWPVLQILPFYQFYYFGARIGFAILPFPPNLRPFRFYHFGRFRNVPFSNLTNFPRSFRLCRFAISLSIIYPLCCFAYISGSAIFPGGMPLAGRIAISDCDIL